MTQQFTVGVLALQGAFAEHLAHLARAAAESPILHKHTFSFVAVRTPEELSKCHALVIPGGESTAMSLIAERTKMLEPLRQFVAEKPVWGTCAGLIFMASSITNAKPHQHALGGLAVQVARNAFGRQLDSFLCDSDFSAFAPLLKSFNTVFIRAPVVSAVAAKGQWKEVGPELDHKALLEAATVVEAECTNEAPVEILHELENGLVVAVRQGKHLGTSFHPELANDALFHAWFLEEFVVGEVQA
ncbi:pyridoxal 5'-phosphate synthase, glutaminase subunit Pdx2 [Candidozyma pseudohaemuli]|uniref:glutaminase n=1 Tax=Candidozyma pseudohaemuli TaxID=418784 RepID=A0A2P7YVC9_9ASCO|nr:pyridoxal 5'-phosphate synthase, glutaminase subunit Pdx2 [[Candida] pseudohaemulonii]PSK39920.1 pyridoxal 5'-phosphate synthase, glutaminase subunit Pdx2 [[Candida] pseudohaemulonii]